MNELRGFLSEVTKPRADVWERRWEDIAFICCSEFGWSQEDFMNSEVPFVLDLLSARKRKIDAEEKEAKKARRR